MLTAEVRINGVMIASIYARNVKPVYDTVCVYECEVYELETGEVRKRSVQHDREDGALALVHAVLLEDAKYPTRKRGAR